MLVQGSFYWVLYYVGTILLFSANEAATSCQVYPSEYAHKDDSVTQQESISANCRRYPNIDGLPQGIYSTDYIHCDGAQLKLTVSDSNIGSEQSFSSSSYYQWPAGSAAQLLFILPTRVSLTTITLHYYSDSDRGLPRLSFYAVWNGFNVWDSPTLNTPRVDVASVPPGGEPAGRRSVSININFNTKKLLMFKHRSNFKFAVSEVEFFTCAVTTASTLIVTNNDYFPTMSAKTTSNNIATFSESNITEKEPNQFTTHVTSMISSTTGDLNKETVPPNSTTRIIAIGVSIVILLMLTTILIIIVIVLILSYKRRSVKQNLYTDCSYSTLSRASGPQTRTRSTQENSSELYDQIHLSPSTGQAEYYIPKSESAKINNPCTTPQNSHPIYSTAGEDTAENSSTLNAITQGTTSQLSLQTAHESTSEQPTYAAIDKSKKKKFKAGEKGPPVSSYSGHSSSAQREKENTTKQDILSPHMVEQLYTAVKKKEKVCEPKDEEEAPPVPPHTVEELYTAVQKKPKRRSNTDRNKDDHNIPPHTEEEMHIAGEIPLQNTMEDSYTAEVKKPKDGSTEDIETAPPIPPHTVEELYTAVMKTPKSGAEDKEKAPPKSPVAIVEKIKMILDKK